MIGEVLQYILDRGFFVVFIYDENTFGYRFRGWKQYGSGMCQVSWVFDDYMVSQVVTKDILIMETDEYLKQVDDTIAQRRLIDTRTVCETCQGRFTINLDNEEWKLLPSTTYINCDYIVKYEAIVGKEELSDNDAFDLMDSIRDELWK